MRSKRSSWSRAQRPKGLKWVIISNDLKAAAYTSGISNPFDQCQEVFVSLCSNYFSLCYVGSSGGTKETCDIQKATSSIILVPKADWGLLGATKFQEHSHSGKSKRTFRWTCPFCNLGMSLCIPLLRAIYGFYGSHDEAAASDASSGGGVPHLGLKWSQDVVTRWQPSSAIYLVPTKAYYLDLPSCYTLLHVATHLTSLNIT